MDVSWGMVLAGAAVAVAIVAFAPSISCLSGIAILKGAGAATYASAAAIGGITAEFVSDLIGRTGSAVTTIARG